MPGGANPDSVLPREIREARAFLSLLTPTAISSNYVLFELGARWGTEKDHIPLLARGAGPEVLKDPIRTKNPLRLSKESDVVRLAEELSGKLNCKAEPASTYLEKARKVAELARGDVTSEALKATSIATPPRPGP